jgi:hypothetical protein
MKPSYSDVHVNRPLTNISIAYIQSATNFVAGKVFPIVPVAKQSDRYFVYDRGDFNRDTAEVRAPSTESAGDGYALDNTPTYYAHVYAIHKDVDDQTAANSDDPLRPEQDATAFVTNKLLLKRERVFATNFLATSKWTTDITGVASSVGTGEALQWSDSTSTPIEDVWTGKEVVLKSTGFEPNTLVLGYSVFKALVNHPDIVDRIKYGQTSGPAVASEADLAALFKVPNVYVMRAIYNTAKEDATDSHDFVGGKTALLVYSAPNPGLLTPSGGYTMSWTGYLGAGAEGNRINRLRMDALKSWRIEGEMAFDMKLVGADLGYFFTSIVA